jgi:hypothetical protein
MSESDKQPGDDTAGIGLAQRQQPARSAAAVESEQHRDWETDAKTTHPAQGDSLVRPGIMRDGFSMPEADYRLIAEIRSSCVELGVLPTKSGILRAGLRALHRMEPQDLVQLIKSLEPVKTGRPAKK